MSSLRLALKQSLAETGHLAIQDKPKRKYNNASSRDLDRKRESSRQKMPSSNKIVSRRKKHFSSDHRERMMKKETMDEFPAEIGRSMSSVSGASSFANSTDADGDAPMRAGARACLESAVSDDANSVSSHEPSSFSDSDTVTNESSCSSHHRHHHRMHSSEDEDSSNHSQSGRDGMQEDMEGVFDMEGTSADESHDHNPIINPTTAPHLFELLQQQGLQSNGVLVTQHHQQPLRKKKKKKDKGKRKKGRQKLNLASSSNYIPGEKIKLSEDKIVNELEEEHMHDETDTLFKKHKVANQDSMPLHDMGNEPCSVILRRPILKKDASMKLTVKEPSPDVMSWVAGMSPGKQRRKIKVGMRVKVCFEFKSNKRGQDGKNIRYYRWCGGGVTRVGPEGKHIRILYDDGTEEDTTFPDREIVVDDDGNGKHQLSVDAFLPYTLLAKQPTRLIAINEANQGIDLNDKIVKEKQDKHGILPVNSGNSKSESVNMQDASSLNTNDLKSEKEERLDDNNVLRLSIDPPNEVENCSHKECHEPSNSRVMKNKISGSSSAVEQSGPEMCITDYMNNCPPGPSLGTSNSGRSLHQLGSSPGQTSASVGAGAQDVSSLRVSKKIKLKRRKSPTPNKHSIDREKNSGVDNVLDSTAAHSTSINVSRAEQYTPSLKIRLKTKSVKHKKRMENASNIHSALSISEFSRIEIKSDQNECNVGESWANTVSTTTKPDSKKLHKPGKSFAVAQGDSVWLGDDEGQGLKISQIEQEEASESERDGTAMPHKGSDKALTAEKLDLECYLRAPNQPIICNVVNSPPNATFCVEGCNTPVKNFLFKGRKHPVEENSNEKVTSFKSEPLPDSSPVFLPLATVPSLSGMAKKKKTRLHNPVFPSPRSSNMRSPKQTKVGRVEKQAGNNSSVTLQENHSTNGKKSKKERRLSPEQIVTFNVNILKPHQNSKKLSKNMREQQLQGCGAEYDQVGKRSLPPLRSDTSGEDGNPKQSPLTGRRPSQITKQKHPPTQDGSAKLKRKNKSKNGGINRSMKEEDNSEGDNWVQCEKCNKWRSLLNSVDVDTLPHLWYCKDNPDKTRNTCAAAEQTQEEVAKEKKLKNTVADVSVINESQLSFALTMQNKKPLAHHRPVDNFTRDSNSEKQLLDKNGGLIDEPKLDMMRSTNNSPQCNSAITNKSASNDLLDEQIADVQMIPDLPSEEGVLGDGIDETASDVTVSTLPSTKNMKGSNKKNRKGKGDEKEKKGSKGKKQKEAVSQEWVQCEKCEKWRRLPPRIKAKDLPDVWTCDMNDWDPRSASCAVQEDYKVEKAINPDKDIIGNDGLGSKAYTNKLSYRNLIRIPNRTISERTRATDSLFPSSATGLPTVMYANSSAFHHKGGMHKSVEDDTTTISLFDYMSKSELWKDLYLYAPQPILPSSNTGVEIRCNNTPTQSNDENFQSMKAMVYYAIGVRNLATHDVLLECQCREWDDLQWIELRARCTIKSVQLALNALVQDGLVKVFLHHSSMKEGICGTITYCRTLIGRDVTGNIAINVEERKVGSRCIKISKPWEQFEMSTGF